MMFMASLLRQFFLPPSEQVDLILRVVILVTLFSAAYNAQVVCGGLAVVPKAHYKTPDALGLDYWQAQGLSILPQALKSQSTAQSPHSPGCSKTPHWSLLLACKTHC
jgi:general L-amino acid transport system permease protein